MLLHIIVEITIGLELFLWQNKIALKPNQDLINSSNAEYI